MSVGNLSVGGTGKTPVVAAIANWLVEQGERPAILSRGYKRRRVSDGVVVVSDGTRELVSVHDAGDEPLMLARQVPGAVVCVGPDRYLSGVLAERRFGCTVHLLDDGFQHIGLVRDLDVLVTAVGEIPQGRVLPAGRLREPMAAAARADFLVVADATVASARSEAWALGISQSAVMTRRLGAPWWLNRTDAPPAISGSVVAVAAVAHPNRFFDALHASGFSVARMLPFGDHHWFTSRDLRIIDATLKDSGATAVVTTEKDAVRLGALQPLPFPIAVVPLEIALEPWVDLTAAVDSALARRRGDVSPEARSAKADA